MSAGNRVRGKMLFNSWLFVAFLVVVLPLYYGLPFRAQNIMLLVASYVFYGAWSWKFLSLIAISTVVDYAVGLMLHRAKDRKARRWLLALSCAVNLGILGYFKYCNFFVDSLVDLLAGLGLSVHYVPLSIVLPVGISFYTFQTMSYTIDVYRRNLAPTRNFLDFALYVAFFPQLVAGPIERATALLPQVVNRRQVTWDRLVQGGWLVLLGFFKKLVIADNLAPVVDRVFGSGDQVGGLECLLAIYAFAYQIYCDFSGYSDIARGLAKWMGFDLMVNFEMPYLARNAAEFWRRWHISLSTWLRDYLYIPLGGNRLGPNKTYRNLMITMLLGGLWHGAAWNFVLWGLFHGGILCIHRPWHRRSGPTRQSGGVSGAVTNVLAVIFMFHVTCVGWLLFRATSAQQVFGFLGRICTDLTPNKAGVDMIGPVVFFPALLWVIEAYVQNKDDPRQRPGWRWGLGPVLVTAMMLALLYLAAPAGGDFIYFRF